jgi:hypothetical protein
MVLELEAIGGHGGETGGDVMSIRFASLFRALFGMGLVMLASPCAGQVLCGDYRTAPGSVAEYYYHDGSYQSMTIPVDVSFQIACQQNALTATIHLPITGLVYPWIASQFPMTVHGTSHDGRVYQGSLLDPGYAFEWELEPWGPRHGKWSGWVQWLGGRFEFTDIAKVDLTKQPRFPAPVELARIGVTVPEPSTIFLMSVGILLVGSRGRRRSRITTISTQPRASCRT